MFYCILLLLSCLSYAQSHVLPTPDVRIPSYEVKKLPNGMSVAYSQNATDDTIFLMLQCRAQWWHDKKQGIHALMSHMLLEGGVKKYPAGALLTALKHCTSSFVMDAYCIKIEFNIRQYQQVIDILIQLLTTGLLPVDLLATSKERLHLDLDTYLNNPSTMIYQQAKQRVYGSQLPAQCSLGSHASINAIQHPEVLNAYTANMVPDGAVMVLVGSLDQEQKDFIERSMIKWQHSSIDLKECCYIQPVAYDSSSNISQLCLIGVCGKSVDYTHPAYEALLLYNILLTERLTAAVTPYLQNGSSLECNLLEDVGTNCGILLIDACVSSDQADKAIVIIKKCLKDTSIISTDRLKKAYQKLVDEINALYAKKEHKARCIVGLESKGLSRNFLVHRFALLKSLAEQPQQVKQQLLPIINQQLHYIRVNIV